MANPVVKIVLQAIDNATDQLNKIEGRFKSFGEVVGGAMKALAAVLTTAAIGKFLKDSAVEALASEKSIARLGLAVSNAGGNFKTLSPALEAAIDGIKRLSKFSDEDLREALGGMITLTGDVAGSTKNLGLAADLAAARQIDLGTASDLVAKAMNGNVTALRKLGVEGTTADEVLGNLRRSMGGAAEIEAQTFGGQLAKLSVGWKDFQEEVGRAILSTDGGTTALGALGGALQSLTTFIVDNQENIGKLALFFGNLVSVVVDATSAVAGFVFELFEKTDFKGQLADREAFLAKTIKGFNTSTKGMTEDQKKILKGFRDSEEKDQKTHSLAIQATIDAANKKKRDAAEEAAKEAKKRADDLAKELEKVNTELAVKLLMIEKGWTQDQAAEFVRRQTIITGHVTRTVGNVKDGYAKLDQANLALAAGFNRDVTPAMKRTEIAIGDLVDTSTSKFPTMKGKVGEVHEAAKGLDPAFRDGAAAIQIFDEKLGAAAGNAVGFADSIGRILKSGGKDPTAWIGTIGSLAGLLSGLFGSASSAAAKAALDAHTKTVNANSERIRALTKTTGDLVDSQTRGKDFGAILKAITTQDRDVRGRPVGDIHTRLNAAGLTDADLDRVAKELGITIRDKDGKLTTSGLNALAKGIRAADTGASNSFAGRVGTIDTGLQIGTVNKADEFGALVGAAGSDNAISRLLGGIDVSSAGGRGQAKLGLQGLFGDLSSGKIGLGDLGGLSRKEFEGLIVRLIGILSSDQEIAGIPITPNQPPIALALSDGFADLSSGFANVGGDLATLGSETNLLLTDIRSLLGGRLAGPGLSPGTAANVGGNTFNGGITVNLVAPPGQDAAALGDAVVDAIEHQLAVRFQQAGAVAGSAVRI